MSNGPNLDPNQFQEREELDVEPELGKGEEVTPWRIEVPEHEATWVPPGDEYADDDYYIGLV